MTNKYVDHMEKEASLLLAGGAHVAQAAGTNMALRSKGMAKRLANNATAGFLNKNIAPTGKLQKITHSMREAVIGVASPETKVLTREAIEMGHKARKELLSQGINPNKLTARQMVGIRQLTRGDLAKAHKRGLHKTPEGGAILRALGIDPKQIDSVNPKALAELEKVYKSKSNPLTSNILSNVTKPDSKLISNAATGTTKVSDIGTQVGNAATALADPLTASINTVKTGLSNPLAAKNKVTNKAREALSETILTKPAKNSFKKGMDGKPLNKVTNTAYTNLVNPISGGVSKITQEAGYAINKVSKGNGNKILSKAEELAKKKAAKPS